MIPVPRTPQPEILKKYSIKWSDKLRLESKIYDTLKNDKHAKKEDINKAKKRFENAQNKYRHTEVKDELVRMFHGKCSYCESAIRHITYGAIEHFFPKSLYPDLTFEWSNFLLSCDRCNDPKHKGIKFPLDSQGNPLLINPTDGMTNPNIHLEFIWDDISGLASVYGRDQRGETVVDIFDLNGARGRKELIEHRSKYIKRLFALLRFARSGDQEAIDLLQESCNSSAEYSAFALIYIHPYLTLNRLSTEGEKI